MGLGERIIAGTVLIEALLAAPLVWALVREHFSPDPETQRLAQLRREADEKITEQNHKKGNRRVF